MGHNEQKEKDKPKQSSNLSDTQFIHIKDIEINKRNIKNKNLLNGT